MSPLRRACEHRVSLRGHRPSAGSVVRSVARCADLLAPRIEEIRSALAQAPLLHADETGVRCLGKTHWLHVVSTATHSLFSYSPKRGVEGFSAAKILPTYTGKLVPDFWGAYDKLECDHSRCNAHLLRELKAFTETGNRWAEEIIAVLLEMKKAADEAPEKKKTKSGSMPRIASDFNPDTTNG